MTGVTERRRQLLAGASPATTIRVAAIRCLVCWLAAALSIVVFPIGTLAQVIPPTEQPGRERERFIEPVPPRAKPALPAITLPSGVAAEGAEKIQVVVREITVVGSSVYSTADFDLLYRDLIGREVSLQTIYDLARRITAKYGNDGYVLSRAIVPPQQLEPDGATVRIEIVEGYIDRVEWPTELLSRYRDFFSNYADKISAGRPANIHIIERYLLLASDLPGLRFSTNLRPSSDTPAASTLVVEVAEKVIDANVRLDNRGTRARGPYQFFTSATSNNYFGNHEAVTISYAGGTRSTSLEAGLSYPLIRARERNLLLTGLIFTSDNHSDILDTAFNEDRLRGLRFRADADAVDGWRGLNQLNFTFSQGINGVGARMRWHRSIRCSAWVGRSRSHLERTAFCTPRPRSSAPRRCSVESAFPSLTNARETTRINSPEACASA